MQSRNERISARSASPCSKLCSSIVTGNSPAAGGVTRLVIVVKMRCCRSIER
jgi:hypothetical protein